jgi:hypothetical protein
MTSKNRTFEVVKKYKGPAKNHYQIRVGEWIVDAFPSDTDKDLAIQAYSDFVAEFANKFGPITEGNKKVYSKFFKANDQRIASAKKGVLRPSLNGRVL